MLVETIHIRRGGGTYLQNFIGTKFSLREIHHFDRMYPLISYLIYQIFLIYCQELIPKESLICNSFYTRTKLIIYRFDTYVLLIGFTQVLACSHFSYFFSSVIIPQLFLSIKCQGLVLFAHSKQASKRATFKHEPLDITDEFFSLFFLLFNGSRKWPNPACYSLSGQRHQTQSNYHH